MTPLDELLLAQARQAQAAQAHAQAQAELARLQFQEALRRLHHSGASMREIARTFDLSHQRVHQLVGECRQACSFCGTSGTAARTLVAGPGVFICERCVDLADGVLAGNARARRRWESLEPPPASGSSKWRRRGQCSFCGKKQGEVAGLAEAGDRRVYQECVDLCHQIVAEALGP